MTVREAGERRAGAGRAQSELPCVWVTAGVLSYRPCDRDFECEACPLYLALRQGGSAEVGAGGTLRPPAPDADDAVARFLTQLGTGCTLHLGRAYGADGVWLEREPSGEVLIGLDDYALRVLQPVDDIVLPHRGVRLRCGAPCAWLSRGDLAIALRTPVAGEVVAVHPRPFTAPRRRGESDAERWWLRLRPREDAPAAAVYRNEGLLDWYLGRLRIVRGHLDAVMERSRVGGAQALLADGGAPEPDLEAVLGPERYEALVGALFPTGG